MFKRLELQKGQNNKKTKKRRRRAFGSLNGESLCQEERKRKEKRTKQSKTCSQLLLVYIS